MKIITFLTDFGMKSGYPAQMKGVVSSITNARYIDITHEIYMRELSFSVLPHLIFPLERFTLQLLIQVWVLKEGE